MEPFKSFLYFLMALIVFYALLFKKVEAENKYYHYEIDEQIRISEDEDYINYSRNLLKEKTLREQARSQQKSMREQELLDHKKARKEQTKRRRRLSLDQKNQEKLETKYEEEMKKEQERQEELHLQYVKQKRRERESLLKEQASIENKFYNNQPLLKQ